MAAGYVSIPSFFPWRFQFKGKSAEGEVDTAGFRSESHSGGALFQF